MGIPLRAAVFNTEQEREVRSVRVEQMHGPHVVGAIAGQRGEPGIEQVVRSRRSPATRRAATNAFRRAPTLRRRGRPCREDDGLAICWPAEGALQKSVRSTPPRIAHHRGRAVIDEHVRPATPSITRHADSRPALWSTPFRVNLAAHDALPCWR